jgi:diguanylate cyclase (GGDEF)-like protein/PAS domain S-box-containing protein
MSQLSKASITSRALFPPVLLAVVMIGVVVLFWMTYRAIEHGNTHSVRTGLAIEQARHFVDELHLGHTALYRAVSLQSQGVEQRIVEDKIAAAFTSLKKAAQALEILASIDVVAEAAPLEQTSQAFGAYLASAKEAADFVETDAFVAAMYLNGADRKFLDAQASASAIDAALAAHRERIDKDAAAALASALTRIGTATALGILLSLAVAASFARMVAAQASAVAETTATNEKLCLAYSRVEEQSDELRNTREFLDMVIENVPTPIVVKDACDRSFVLLNRAAEQFMGLSREQILGKTAYDIYPAEGAAMLTEHDNALLASQGQQLIGEHLVDTPGNGKRSVVIKALPVLNVEAKPRYLLTVIEDVTERKEAQARIAHMAHHDALTDLPNRAAFNEYLVSAVEGAHITGKELAVLCLDLDRFKEINDVFGHRVGDALLCRASERLRSAAEGTFVARLGGDEFVLIISNGRPLADPVALADRIFAAFADEFDIEGHRVRTGVSIGVAVFPNDGTDPASIVGNADAALYRAKAEGRGTVRFFEAEMDRQLREKRALQQDLHGAISGGQLLLHYQPQATIAGEIIGFEALARWRHPVRGLVPPAVFIPLAEENGTIIAIGEWILREVCQEAASWPQMLNVSVNLSPVQFLQGDLPKLVHTALFESGLAPNRLELEVTEGVLIGDYNRAVSILRRIKAVGVRIAMDDFGTGYSSLSYLHSFPFDKIKIDRTFVSNVERDAQSAAIIRAVIGLGKGLHLPIIAEGVETAEQLAFLTRVACDEVQGYLIGRPCPIAGYDAIVGRVGSTNQQTAMVG